MAKIKGSKDGRTWEETVRQQKNGEGNRFSAQFALRNLRLLKEWSGEKIRELSQEK